MRICTLQTDLVRPKVHKKFSSCEPSVVHSSLIVAAWKQEPKVWEVQVVGTDNIATEILNVLPWRASEALR